MPTRLAGPRSPPVRSKDDLIAWIAAGAKSRDACLIGTEHEKFVFYTDTLEAVPYEGERGIRVLMEAMMASYRWEPILEAGRLIALKRPEGEIGGIISLEPGGQFEFSDAPVRTLHDTAAETEQHLLEVLRVGERLGIGFLGLGFSPKWTLAETPRMPKGRYDVTTRYMPLVGSRGLDMMYRTASVQVNLDFSSERDMIDKLRASLALQPIATALFASSPFTDGRPNGFKSMRSEVWRNTDPARTGLLPFVFESGMSYEAYVDYALDVPMYFVYRDGHYIDVAGCSFREFMAGRLPGLEGELPTLDDWADHLTTLFPEVRLKRFLEMRGSDGGRCGEIVALSALWVGLLYDEVALAGALDVVKDWTAEEREQLRQDVPKGAFEAPFRRGKVLDIARDVVQLAHLGLRNRREINFLNQDETIYLAPLEDIVARGKTCSDVLLERYRGRWGGHIDPIFLEFAF